MTNPTPSLWEFKDEKTMLSHLIGNSFGNDPEKKLDLIREEKRKMAGIIAAQLGLKKSVVVAELGSGTGYVANHMAPLVKKLHCCDISASFLGAAQKECAQWKNVSYHQITTGKLEPLAADSLDAIYSLNTFIHFNLYDVYHYFREFQRVVKPGGRVWFDILSSDALPGELPGLFLEMAGLYSAFPDGLPLLVQYLSPRAVAGIAQHFGFRIALPVSETAPAPWMMFEKVSQGRR